MTLKEFTAGMIKTLTAGGIKIFPDDFLSSIKTTPLNLPAESLIIGNEFFGSYEVMTASGNIFCHTDTLIRAKYIVYAGRKNKDCHIPEDEKEIEATVRNYEKYLDDIMRKISGEYKIQIPEGKETTSAVKDVFRILNLIRL